MLETKTLAEEEQVKKPQPALQNSLFRWALSQAG